MSSLPLPPAPFPVAQPSRRVPHLGHVALFLFLLLFTFVLCALPLFLHMPTQTSTLIVRGLAAQAGAYALTLGAAWLLLPHLWHQRFTAAIGWNARAVGWTLIPLGLALGLVAQGVETLLPDASNTPLEEMFRTPGLIWPLALFGVLLGPLFEEVFFRGFLLPALAIAVDWLRLPRQRGSAADLAAYDAWRAGDRFSPAALVVASLLASALFAVIHAAQLGWHWPYVALLGAVSLVLCWVRLRWRSVAASTVVHGCYNLSVFVTLFVVTGGFRHLDKL